MTDLGKLIDPCDLVHENTDLLICTMCRSPNVVLSQDSVSRLYFIHCEKCNSSRTTSYKILYVPLNYAYGGKPQCKYIKIELD